MKKVIIATIIALSFGLIKSKGTVAGTSLTITDSSQQALNLEEFSFKGHTHVEDGVFVEPSFALDLFNELQN